jgi:hypothetical protein
MSNTAPPERSSHNTTYTNDKFLMQQEATTSNHPPQHKIATEKQENAKTINQKGHINKNNKDSKLKLEWIKCVLFTALFLQKDTVVFIGFSLISTISNPRLLLAK